MSNLRPYFNWLRLTLYCVLASFCALIACVAAATFFSRVAAQTEMDAHFIAATCRFPLPEQQAVECGDLDVPEDYANPQGRRIRLHVAIVRSSSSTPAPDPLIILYGGPGAYALDRLDNTIEHFARVLTARDIILFDPRGVGYSQPSLNCPELDSFDVTAIDEQLNGIEEFESRLAAYRSCRDRLEISGIDLHNYSADALTADVVSLRQALNYDKWNLYGVSYGARQTLILMRDFPDGLKSVVLDSAYPVDIDLARETAYTHAYALDMLFAANKVSHPRFEQTFFALINELDTEPVNIPALIPQRWIFPYQPFNGDDLLQLTISIVRRWPQSFPHMPGFIDDIEDGNYVDLMELAKPSVGDQLFSEGMNLSVVCQEIDPATQHPKDDIGFPIEPRVYEFARASLEQRMALCELWLGQDWEPRPQAPAVNHIPALVLRGEQDAVVPSSWNARAMQSLPNSFGLSFLKTGHGVLNSNACARETVAAFLLDPTIMPDAGCWN